MSLPDDYLKYPNRRYGMDHDRYKWSNLFSRPRVSWPSDAKLALWITVGIEFFPLTPNQGPFRAPGHMATPFPDFRTYTTRDYGNRVGIFRIMKVLDALGLKASVCLNSQVASRYPPLMRAIAARNWEVIAHGTDMNAIHLGEMAPDMEARQIDEALDEIERAMGVRPKGWLSPGLSESRETTALLAKAGLDFVCDWQNDDMPYEMSTAAGPIHAMPYTTELEDRHILINLGQNEEVYTEQVLAAFDRLAGETEEGGGRVLHLALTPYIIGQPFRIRTLRELLERLVARGGIWNAGGAEILAAWQACQPSNK